MLEVLPRYKANLRIRDEKYVVSYGVEFAFIDSENKQIITTHNFTRGMRKHLHYVVEHYGYELVLGHDRRRSKK